MFSGIKKAFEKLFDWLGQLFQWLLDGLVAILQPILDLVVGVAYFIYKIGVLLVDVVVLFGGVAKLALGLLQGLFKTISGLSYQGTPSNLPGSIGDTMQHLTPIFQTLQLNKLAYLIIFSIWIFTAFYAIKMIQNFSGGGES